MLTETIDCVKASTEELWVAVTDEKKKSVDSLLSGAL
jgi:hypothetical protein